MKNQKRIQKMFIENNIEHDNFTLVIRLKKKVEDLSHIIEEQQRIIFDFKKDIRITKINQMEIELQHLNDENKRLLLVIDQFKSKQKASRVLSPKKSYLRTNKQKRRSVPIKHLKYENKVYEVLKENEFLKKEIMNIKVNENLLNERKSTINDRNNILLQKNLVQYDKLNQQKMDLEAEMKLMSRKIKNLQEKVNKLTRRNQELQKINFQHFVFTQQNTLTQ